MIEEFINGLIAIEITNVTDEQMREIQRLTGKKWASDADLDKYHPFRSKNRKIYIHCNTYTTDNNCITYFDSVDARIYHSLPSKYVSVEEFLGEEPLNIDENEFERMFS